MQEFHLPSYPARNLISAAHPPMNADIIANGKKDVNDTQKKTQQDAESRVQFGKIKSHLRENGF